jgi:hypothetical protein
MRRETQWSPDTCSCILVYEWDDAQPESARTHSFKRAVRLCEHHKGLAEAKAYDKVLAENTLKNLAYIEARKIKPSLMEEDYTWSFDEARKLKVGFLGRLTVEEKSNLQARYDDKFGRDEVRVL